MTTTPHDAPIAAIHDSITRQLDVIWPGVHVSRVGIATIANRLYAADAAVSYAANNPGLYGISDLDRTVRTSLRLIGWEWEGS